MLSKKITKLLIKLFHEIAKGESLIESSRRIMTYNYDFDSFQIFNYLDQENKNRIDSIDIMNYLNYNNIKINDIESQLIIFFYDQNFDGVLTYEEFKPLILNENYFNSNSPNNFFNEISKEIDECLLNILKNELKLAKKCLMILNDLNKENNFNIHNIYHALRGINCINEESLKNFLNNYNEIFSLNDLKMIKRRLDINKDGKIDLGELHVFLGYPKCYTNCNFIPCSSCGMKNCPICYKDSKCILHDINHEHNLLNENKEELILGNKNFVYNFNYKENDGEFDIINEKLNFLTNSHLINTNNSEFNGINKYSKTQISEKNGNIKNNKDDEFETIFDTKDKMINEKLNKKLKEEENEFLEYLKEIMISEKKIEKSKIELILNSDFNSEDAFKIFTTNSKNFIKKNDLKYGLNLLNIYPTSKELDILIHKYSLKNDNIIQFSDFFDMIIPYEIQYRDLVKKRKSNSDENISRSPLIFSYKTSNDLKNLFNIIIKEENKLNDMRKLFSSDLKYNLEIYLNKIDITKNNYFDEQDLLLYLKKNKILIDEDSCVLLFIRLDYNHDGEVNLFELKKEFNSIF